MQIAYNGGLNMKKKVIIKNVQGYYDGERGFIVIPVQEEAREELSDFCEIPDTNELLFTMSKFTSYGAADGLDVSECKEEVGSVLVSVKLESADYEWTYKGKKGRTKKWQVCGLLFKSPVVNSDLEGLEDD